ncbi:MAG: ABC transporter ATP-binding protein [Nitrospinota bacterium]|jgi:lipoprotein-releasing system ATP-binding protein|nr:ABC transporter ATP-binding protein [Nitrospinota bacterium]HJN01690.1 ABC transporter ATP-binding protein [Nitrospinota bacterium]
MSNEVLISVQNLEKSFKTGKKTLKVLKNLNFGIMKGEMVAIMGPSGVGKSTLLHLMGTLDRPSTGKILFNQTNLFEMNDRRLADFRNKNIGFVFQFHHLLPEFTARENVMMPLLIQGIKRKDASERANTILGDLELGDRISHKTGELSGGEQQRVAIARALANDPEVILADEPTGNLDQKTGEKVHHLLKELKQAKNKTLVVVTHNNKLSDYMDRVLIMEDGKIL